MAELKYVDWDGLVYYDGKIKSYIADKAEDYLKMGGAVTFDELPDPSYQNLNYIYKITNEFVSNSDFEKPGYRYKAGTWVQVSDINNTAVYRYTIFNEETIGGTADLSNYYTKPEVDQKLKTIEDTINSIEVPDVSEFATKEEVAIVTSDVTDITNQLTEDIRNIQNTYVTTETLEQNYITIEQGVTKDTVTALIEQEVETVIQEKVDAGEITVNSAQGITYGTW